MNENAIYCIERSIEEILETPANCTEFKSAKVEGALDLAYSLDLINHEQFVELYKSLLKAKKRLFL